MSYTEFSESKEDAFLRTKDAYDVSVKEFVGWIMHIQKGPVVGPELRTRRRDWARRNWELVVGKMKTAQISLARKNTKLIVCQMLFEIEKLVINYVFQVTDGYYDTDHQLGKLTIVKEMEKAFVKFPELYPGQIQRWNVLKEQIRWEAGYGNSLQELKEYRVETAHPEVNPQLVENTFNASAQYLKLKKREHEDFFKTFIRIYGQLADI